MTWHAKEALRGLYQIADPGEAADYLDSFIDDAADESVPEVVRSLAKTSSKWRDLILAWHTATVTNGPAESTNNLIKKVKRVSVYRPSVLLVQRGRAVIPSPGQFVVTTVVPIALLVGVNLWWLSVVARTFSTW